MIPLVRLFVLSCLTLCLFTPVAYAQTAASSAGSMAASSGAVVDIWAERAERAEAFAPRWASFALVHRGWITKWQKAHGRLGTHINRCHDDVRGANRDTLLTVTLQCYRGQLLIERDALKNERAIIEQWPAGFPAESKTAILEKIDALLGAVQPVVDAIDANVFTTLNTFRDVRANLRTQYRQPYWMAVARFRADAAITWLDSVLIALHTLSQEQTLPPTAQEKLLSALDCYEAAEPLLIAARAAETLEESHKNFTEAGTFLSACPSFLSQAQTLQQQPSSSSSSH